MRMPILIAKLDVPQIICNIVNARMSPLTSDQVYAAHAAACAFLPTDVACHIPHSPEIMNVQVWSMQFVIPVKPPLLTPPIQQQQQQTNKRKRAVLEHLPAPVPPRMREQQTPEEEWMNTVLR
jgi:anaerobic C4-dicarboxylate transporter